MRRLNLENTDLSELIDQLSPKLRHEPVADDASYSLADARARLLAIDPEGYSRTRNYFNGKVTRLSIYITAGIFSVREIVEFVLERFGFAGSQKLLSELMWRMYFRSFLNLHPQCATHDYSPYKTGFFAEDYGPELPSDIRAAHTPSAAINSLVTTLVQTGYLHNHARMYLSAYVVHVRRIRWQAGASWMFHHLIDGDQASNALSWQWVASTLSAKPYFFNLENLQKFSAGQLDASEATNPELAGTYPEREARLFRQQIPHKEGL
ncbi:MAG: DNA photolyase [Clostridia bacterium]|nr:DNA photolyase [Clostridia bacterium]NCC76018.1 DNA photolyase [Clostridia bacterium]